MLKEKIEEIKERLSFTNKELSNLLDIKMNILVNCKDEYLIISKLKEVFNLNDELKKEDKLPLLKIIKPLNMKKYKNRVNAYNRIIKDYHTSKWKIFVLTKTRVKEKITLSSLFKKQELKNNKIEFSPSFLGVSEKTKLLINFKEDNLIIQELEQNLNENVFIIDQIKYKKANELKIS